MRTHAPTRTVFVTRAIALAVLTCQCAAPRPKGEEAERQAAEEAGESFSVPHEERDLPVLPSAATLQDVLRYAFLSNAELEASYYQWRAALERIPQAVALPDPRINLRYLFSEGQMSRWDRTTLGAAQMVPFPGKLEVAGEIALEDAIAARYRFENTKFSLQAQVVAAFAKLWELDRTIEIEEENLRLLEELRDVSLRLVSVGRAIQADATKADLEVGVAENSLLQRRAERAARVARLNALLSREPASEVDPTQLGFEPLGIPEDAEILRLAAERNPELAAIAAEVRGSEQALALAWKEWLPDFEFGFGLRGSVERMLTGMLTVPLQFDRIQAGIDEAQAGLRAARAAARARGDDLGAQVVLQLFLARDSERQIDLLRDVLIPRATEVVDGIQAAYATGGTSFLELLDAQRSLLALRLGLLRVEALRAAAVARLEALCAFDFGSLSGEEE